MGLFDSIKNVFGSKSEDQPDVTVSPSQMLREAGVDPGRLDMTFGSDGSVSVSGEIADESERKVVIDTLSGAPGINRVDDQMTVAAPEVAEEAPAAIEEEAPSAAQEAADKVEVEPPAQEQAATQGDRKYTVQSGDTLWKISEEMYGNGSNYMKIFEANTDILEHPDRIFPGQELTIPELNN